MTELIQFVILFVHTFTRLLYWIMIIYILMSWFITRPNYFWNMLGSIVRPILKPFRWARIGMIDFSPILALLILDFIANYLIDFLTIQFLSS